MRAMRVTHEQLSDLVNIVGVAIEDGFKFEEISEILVSANLVTIVPEDGKRGVRAWLRRTP